ncbi:phosphate transport system substrate-binding protein [Desulfosalsimonas propionicica]|jgi:phosphate transport system substrate-binding protein|uniref:Phosphate-binding protein n=1 Tax=Desulfosalsimonas propionicica TaxID=332175 RepID=A0A7W0HK72_9BACT|nr:phosphate ABC transporter substrate-binding protein [Desulfosalsimonas propionicica]MBA2880984.1 phosphate transport system substrate-binding protein [Desulfosalsimonas propionicica]
MKRLLMIMLVFIMGLTLGTTQAWSAEKLTIKGSTTVLPVTQKVAEAFMEKYPDVNISISGGGSGNGIKALIDGTTDICQASRFIKDEEVKRAVENGHYPVPFGVALDSIIPVVNPDNPVDDLSLEELRGIYNGDITNWKEVGGTDRRITLVSRDSSSGTYGVWGDIILKGDRVTPRAQTVASNGAAVETVKGNPYAIGYIGIGYLDEDLKNVKIDGVEGTPETTASGEFPVSRYLYYFTDGWPSGTALKFINFALHPEKGQPLAENVGYVPLY